MATSDYKCENCGFIILDHEKVFGESFPETIPCPECTGVANRIWKTSIIIPETMKATFNEK